MNLYSIIVLSLFGACLVFTCGYVVIFEIKKRIATKGNDAYWYFKNDIYQKPFKEALIELEKWYGNFSIERTLNNNGKYLFRCRFESEFGYFSTVEIDDSDPDFDYIVDKLFSAVLDSKKYDTVRYY